MHVKEMKISPFARESKTRNQGKSQDVFRESDSNAHADLKAEEWAFKCFLNGFMVPSCTFTGLASCVCEQRELVVCVSS